MKTVNIYTDGACKGNQAENNQGGWAFILECEGREKEVFGYQKNTTNNRMELMALISALLALKQKGLTLRIFSDSSYLINCLKNRWYENWKKNGWKTASKTPVENKDLWMQILELLEGQLCEYYLVKGHIAENCSEESFETAYKRFMMHNGSFTKEEFKSIAEYNRRCDKLASEAAEK